MRLVRAGLFVVAIYALMGVMGVLGLPAVLHSERATRAWAKLYVRIAFGLARGLCGIRVEIRGPVPADACIVAAKHQSLLDVLALFVALPRAQFVMKRSLIWAPVFGLYAWRIGSTPIDRGSGGAAQQVMNWAERRGGGQLVIFPQGTRVPPGARAPYRRGAAALQSRTGLPMVLAATNGGLFWPRRGLGHRPGRAVVAFIEVVPPGLAPEAALARAETVIEAASDALAVEGGLTE